ncbi:phenylalanine--tRNA ligase subunit alpha, partial [Candidatus Uhrbacteria bacterium]|nr:phenylalanine--tRNA ligase subunit alpha [Candidatus Uhrbacteria bacterium]
MMMQKLDALREELLAAIENVKTLEELEQVEITFLGRKGSLTLILRQLGSLPTEERKALGARSNEIKMEAEQEIGHKRRALSSEALASIGNRERIDVTEPGIRPPEGHLHLVTQAIREVTDIFNRIGFKRVRHPEVDWDWYAFESLNMPGDHPARDEWETFFMDAPASDQGKMV